MSAARRQHTDAAPGAGPTRPPVVITFDNGGELLDVVGDVDWFVAAGDTAEDLYRRLRDLREGGDGKPELVQSVELCEGRFADVHVVDEEDSHHFVLLDASEVMQVLRRSQQTGNEIALLEARQRRAMRAPPQHPSQRLRAMQPFRQGTELFAELINEMRAPLALLAGHARLLEQRHRDDPAALRSIAAIQHAAVRLEAISSNGLVSLGELGLGTHRAGVLEVAQLASLLQQTFALQAQMRGIDFRVELPRRDVAVEIDDLALRQVLTNLIVHALDGIESGELVVTLAAVGKGLEIEISHPPGGFRAGHFGPLVTTGEVLQSNPGGSLGLAVSQLLLQKMRAAVELVAHRDGGYGVWIKLPVTRAAAGQEALRVQERPAAQARLDGERVAVVAVEPAASAAELVGLLAELGVPAVAVHDAARVEALRRDDAVALLVVSAAFDGRPGRELLRRLGLDPGTGVLLLTGAAGRSGWLQDHGGVEVAADAGRDTVRAALLSVLGR